MIGRLAAFGAVVLAAATTLAPVAPGAGADVRMVIISATPRPPQAARPFVLVARVEFVPAPGSLHASVSIGGKRYRKIRLSWQDPIARCSFVVPAEAHGKRLTVALTATLGGSSTRTTLGFTVPEPSARTVDPRPTMEVQTRYRRASPGTFSLQVSYLALNY